jgi:hypothetical protein
MDSWVFAVAVDSGANVFGECKTDKKPGILAGFFSHVFFLLFAFDALAMRSSSFRSSAVSSSLSFGLGGRLGKGITSGTYLVLPYYSLQDRAVLPSYRQLLHFCGMRFSQVGNLPQFLQTWLIASWMGWADEGAQKMRRRLEGRF